MKFFLQTLANGIAHLLLDIQASAVGLHKANGALCCVHYKSKYLDQKDVN